MCTLPPACLPPPPCTASIGLKGTTLTINYQALASSRTRAREKKEVNHMTHGTLGPVCGRHTEWRTNRTDHRCTPIKSCPDNGDTGADSEPSPRAWTLGIARGAGASFFEPCPLSQQGAPPDTPGTPRRGRRKWLEVIGSDWKCDFG
mgnify:CR=1 FL=1